MNNSLEIKRIKQMRKKVRILMIIFSFLSIGFLSLLIIYISKFNYFYPQSFLVVLNLKEETISVNESVLQIYDSFVEATNKNKFFNVKNTSGENLFQKSIYDKEISKITLFVNSSNKYCFFTKDVTTYYYDLDSPTLSSFSTTTFKSENNVFEMTLDPNSYLYIFPGKYSSDELPDNLLDKALIGIYFIDCEKINNIEEQEKIIMFSKDFDAKKQRDFYFNQTDILKKELL